MAYIEDLRYYAMGILIISFAIFLIYLPNVINFIRGRIAQKRLGKD